MTRTTTASLAASLLLSTAWAAPLQDRDDGALDTPSDINDDELDLETDDVVVVDGVRRRGVTLTDIEPEVTLTESDIEAYGVSSLAELLQELAPETSSGRGRRGSSGGPVVLLNGRRISGFREIGRYPPEALARVEVLPEEAALAYGFSADQRVINFVLKPNVVVRAAEGEVETPDQGGTTTLEGSFQRLSVDGPRRFSIDFRYESESPLLESERDFQKETSALPFASPGNLGADNFGDPIGATLGGDPSFTVAALQGSTFDAPIIGATNDGNDQALRTLRPENEELSLGFSRAGDFFWESTLTLTGQVEHAESDRLLGQAEVALDLPASNPFVPFADGITLYAGLPGTSALAQNNETDTYSGGFSIVSKPGITNWTMTGSYEHVETETRTELGILTDALQTQVDGGADPFAVLAGQLERSLLSNDTTTDTASVEFIVNSRPVALPAGDLAVTTQVGFRTRQQDVETNLDGVITDSDLSRDTANAQVSVDVPVLFAEEEGGFGDLSLNANVSVSDLSDFGTLTTWGGGFNWRPTDRIRLIASYTKEEGAPSIGELGDPVLITPNVRVFDFATGETVLVESITGGNADLIADTRDVSKLGLQWKPIEGKEITFNMDYTQSFLQDEARSFPALTAEVEAAFPDRFVRDANGTLLSIDRRPVNFDESNQRQLRTGFNWSQSIGQQRGGGRPSGRPSGRPGGGRPTGAGGPPQQRSGAAAGPPSGRPAAAGGPPQQGASGQSGRPPQASSSGGRPQQASGRPRRGATRSGRPARRFISLYHTWVLEDSILIRDGLPELDLLNGSAIGNRGGTSAHQVTFSVRQWKDGAGFFSRVNWRSGTDVDGDLTGGSDLSFSDLATVDLRFSYDLGYSEKIMNKAPWLRDTRAVFAVDNLFNDRIQVTNADGDIPIQFQPDLIDPLGRVFEFEIRKRF
ncbi:MAG: TonB-dependent receptor [Pseudomonadota bacterium]